MRVICVYVPNGESIDSHKYSTSCAGWTRCTPGCAEELRRYPRLALLGDFNIAPEDRDVHDPRLWEGKVLFSEPEREAASGACSASG